jgi:16S rRNA (adenine1518-N6/adenine1519-N6)-dimethyltransferase
VAGNIPYYITSPIIKKVLTLKRPAERVVLLVQKEVADRLVDEKETVLSLFVKNYADIKLGPVVLKEEFTPPPKVDSAVIVLKPHAAIVEDKVFELIKRGFKAPRKKLVHNLMGLANKEELTRKMAEIGISLNARPGDLKLEEWQKLSYHLSK